MINLHFIRDKPTVEALSNTDLWRLALYKNYIQDFPGGTVVKNLPANAGDVGSSPGLGRSHMQQSN